MTPVMNNGIFLRDTSFSMGNHLDEAHLFRIASHEPMDMGIIDLWAMTQKKEMPLYSMASFGGKNTIYTPDTEFKWKVPISTDIPYIVDDICESDFPGRAGTTFQIKLSTNAYGHGAILTYDKYNGLEMVTTEDPIIKVTNGAIYTVKLINQKNDQYLDRKYLKAGTKIIRVGSTRTEHSTGYDDFLIDGGGYREFYNFVGTSEASAQFSVSKYAEAHSHSVSEHRSQIMELWRINGANADPSINSLADLAKAKGGMKYIKDAMNDGKVSVKWIPKLEAIAMNKIASDIENYLMWGKGGLISNNDGPVDTRLSTGLWKQLDGGYKKVYTKAQFNLDMFEAEIYNFFRGKINFDGPDSNRKLIVQTGLAGMRLINKAIRDVVNNSGMILNATDVGALYGNPMSLGFGVSYTQYKIPFLANLEFVVNTAFDNVHNNELENPTIDGFPLSSYSFIIYDYNAQMGSDNINLIRWAPGNDKRWSDIQWHYQQGDFPYLGIGDAKGFQSMGDFSGYRVKMSQIMPMIWVKDPTKVLKFVMKNPFTGGTL